MENLGKIIKGKQQKPLTLLVYGPPGVGKTTFASEAKSPVFVGDSGESGHLDVDRFPTTSTYEEVLEHLNDIKEESYKTVVVDNLSFIEPLVWDKVCRDTKAPSIERALGGYAKGYIEALKYWGEIRDALRVLRDEKGMNVILVAHSRVKAINDPISASMYDKVIVDLHDKAMNLFYRWVDNAFFINYEVLTNKDDSGKMRAYNEEGKRVIYTESRTGFEAKTRFKGLPPQLPLDFKIFGKAVMDLNKKEKE